PPAGGKVTYKVSYAGDATHAAAGPGGPGKAGRSRQQPYRPADFTHGTASVAVPVPAVPGPGVRAFPAPRTAWSGRRTAPSLTE
ncbi:hypothetical protein, partial [Streptomyces sp. NPDC004100]